MAIPEIAPAAIYRLIMHHAEETLPRAVRDNLDVVIDAYVE